MKYDISMTISDENGEINFMGVSCDIPEEDMEKIKKVYLDIFFNSTEKGKIVSNGT